MTTSRAPLVRLPDPGDAYDPQQQAQFKVELERALEDIAQSVQRVSATDPTALTSGDNDDYAVGLQTTTVRLTPDASGSTITGITGGYDARPLRIINIGSGPLTLAHQDTGSSAENRLLAPSTDGLTIVQNEAVDLEYDANEERWRILRPVVAALTSLTLAVFDDGTDNDFTVDWTVNGGVTDAAHDLELYVSNLSGPYGSASTTESSPKSTTQWTPTLAGTGDGAANDHFVQAALKDSSGTIVSLLTATATSTI